MAYNFDKKYPQNFSKDITDVISDLVFDNGSKPFMQGSANKKINYPSDYDLAQFIPVSKKNNLTDFQKVIKKILERKDTYIADIKSGEIPALKIVDDDLNINNYSDKRNTMIEKLNNLHLKKHITKEELNSSLKLLLPELKEIDIYIIKHDIRFQVIRWKPEDILKGFVNYRGFKIGYFDYLWTDSLTKIDIVAWVNGIRFNEISIIYFFTKNGKPINGMINNIRLYLINEIPYLLYKKKYMKICKRIGAIEQTEKNQQNDHIEDIIFKLSNSNLGRLNQVISDFTALEYLIENYKVLPKERIKFEIDQIKYRLGIESNKKYLDSENVIIKLLDELDNNNLNLDKIDKLKSILSNILEEETLKFMKEYHLYPIPKQYLPPNFTN